ncbi:MAG: ACP S-malonyltransferase [Ktedonobacterales bacterium]
MSERIAFVFPGQGSQAVGMGADVCQVSPAARRVFEIADQAIGMKLSEICFTGPEEKLRETINTQPALVATSLAILAALQETAGAGGHGEDPDLNTPLRPSYVAGHSVGEYAALAAAGALRIADTVRLVRERGRLMHQEGVRCPSGMAAVLGLDAETLRRICAEATEQACAHLGARSSAAETHPGAGCVVVANDNAPGQIVISGARAALESAMELARAAGARRVVSLPVSGAFHSPVMTPAAHGLAQAVAAAPLRDAAMPLIANRDGLPITSADDLRIELAEQIASPVQWTGSIEYLLGQGVQAFVEIGAGQVLSGLIKRIAKGVPVISVATAADIAPVALQLQGRLDA